MQKPSDAETLQGLKNQERAAYRLLYQYYYPVVEKFVLRNNGTKADAGDVFQDTMVVLWRQVSRDDFVLTASLKTYIYAISQNLWLKRLQKAKRGMHIGLESLPEGDAEFPFGWESPLAEEKTLAAKITHWLGRITAHCQALLSNLFLLGKNAKDLGYKNKHTAHNQQYKCLQQLRRSATDGPEKDQ